MESLIETFHLDLRLLIAQAINFAIVFFVLYFFALKPLFKVMKEREDKIAKSMDDAKKAEEYLIEAESKYKTEINRAKKEANEILEKAILASEEKKKEILNKAKEEIAQAILKEKEDLRQEQGRMMKEIKADIGGLVMKAVEKVLEEKVDSKKDEELIKKIVSAK